MLQSNYCPLYCGLILAKKKKNNNHDFACAAHFFVHCFAFVLQLQGEISQNFLVTRFMEEITYVFLFPILSLPLIFTSVAISIFHFLTAATKINCYVLFFFNEIRLLCYPSQSPSFIDFICRGFIF